MSMSMHGQVFAMNALKSKLLANVVVILDDYLIWIKLLFISFHEDFFPLKCFYRCLPEHDLYLILINFMNQLVMEFSGLTHLRQMDFSIAFNWMSRLNLRGIKSEFKILFPVMKLLYKRKNVYK